MCTAKQVGQSMNIEEEEQEREEVEETEEK